MLAMVVVLGSPAMTDVTVTVVVLVAWAAATLEEQIRSKSSGGSSTTLASRAVCLPLPCGVGLG